MIERLAVALARLQVVFAVLPLAFVAAFVARVAPNGFRADASLYPRRIPGAAELGAGIRDLVPAAVARPKIALATRSCGLATGLTSRTDLDVVATGLAPGCAGVAIVPSVADAAWRSDLLVLLDLPDGPFDLPAIAGSMRGRILVDGTDTVTVDAAATAGLRLVRTPTRRPFWLDPDLVRFTRAVERAVPPDAGILVTVGNVRTRDPGSRWYLALNLRLYPRRLYLTRARLASGRVGQFQQWSPPPVPPATLGRELAVNHARWHIQYDQTTRFADAAARLEPGDVAAESTAP